MKIGLVGDYDASIPAHRAIPEALRLAGAALDLEIQYEWVPTEEIHGVSRISNYDGLWCVPASPYRNMDGALLAIQYARENNIPFLGTCGGFQHAIIEYARNVLGWQNVEHAETAPTASRLIITRLACPLVETMETVRFVAGSKLEAAYGRAEVEEGYKCNYGPNPAFVGTLFSRGLRVAAHDMSGEVRAMELNGHSFFVATLFQPERAALPERGGQLPPLAAAFVQAVKLHLEWKARAAASFSCGK